MTGKLAIDVAFDGRRIRVLPKLPPYANPESLVAAQVRVRGTVAASFNATLRQLTSVNVYVPTSDDFIVEKPESHSPVDQPILPLGEIARYRPDVNKGGRVHVRGVLTLQRPGLDLFIQDATGGLHLESIQGERFVIGDVIEAVGFLDIAGYRPVVEDARCWRIGVGSAMQLHAVPFTEIRDGLHGSELVTLSGRLVGRTARPVRRDRARFVAERTICTIQNSDFTFTVECEHDARNGALGRLELGSLVEVTGIASVEAGDDGQMKILTLLLRTPEDVQVVEGPSWFTVQRLLVGLGVLFIVFLGVAGWSVTVSKKNAMLRFLVAEREKSATGSPARPRRARATRSKTHRRAWRERRASASNRRYGLRRNHYFRRSRGCYGVEYAGRKNVWLESSGCARAPGF